MPPVAPGSRRPGAWPATPPDGAGSVRHRSPTGRRWPPRPRRRPPCRRVGPLARGSARGSTWAAACRCGYRAGSGRSRQEREIHPTSARTPRPRSEARHGPGPPWVWSVARRARRAWRQATRPSCLRTGRWAPPGPMIWFIRWVTDSQRDNVVPHDPQPAIHAACVVYQGHLGGDRSVVDSPVVGQDRGNGKARQIVSGIDRCEPEGGDSFGADHGVEDRDDRPATGEFVDHLERGRLAIVGDVAFVGDSHSKDLRAADRQPGIVEQLGDALGVVCGHLRVHLFGEVDEASGEVGLTGAPRQVLRVERHTVASYPRSRPERLEAEGLGGGGLDHLPDVDVERTRQLGHLVDQPDVDRPIGVLEELRHLGGASRWHHVNGRNEATVRRRSDGARSRGDAPDDLGDVPRLQWPTRRHPLRGERQPDVTVELQAGPRDGREEEPFRRAGIGRRLETDQLTRSGHLGNGIGGCLDEREVGLTVAPQGARHADDDRIRRRQGLRIIGDRGAAWQCAAQGLVADVVDRRPTSGKLCEPVSRNVKPDAGQAALDTGYQERKADVSQADNSQPPGRSGEKAFGVIERKHGGQRYQPLPEHRGRCAVPRVRPPGSPPVPWTARLRSPDPGGRTGRGGRCRGRSHLRAPRWYRWSLRWRRPPRCRPHRRR